MIAALVQRTRTTSSSCCVEFIHRSCPCAASPAVCFGKYLKQMFFFNYLQF
jgi:hypothetical protein